MERIVLDPHASLSPEAMAVLRERSVHLATRDKSVATDAAMVAAEDEIYVCFGLMDERYGLPLAVVNEVFPLRNIVPIPGAPRHVLGLTRIRGKVLALVDLRRYWHGAAVGHADSDLAVFVEEEGGVEFGLVCSEVLGLLRIAPEAVEEVPRNIPPRLAASLRGFTSDEIMLISSSRLRSQEGFLVQQAAAEE